MSVHELMEHYGFTFRRKCSCDGYVTEKWIKGDLEFSWRKYKYIFKLKDKKTVLQNWLGVDKLENYLNEFFKEAISANA